MAGPKTVILFDFDGTIADTSEVVLRSLEHTLEAVAPGRFTRERLIAELGLPLDVQFRRLLPEMDPAPLIDRYRAYQRTIFDDFIRPVPGAQKVLRTLADVGVRLGVATSRQRSTTERGLRHLGLIDCFETIVAFEDVARHKPDPEPLLTALRRLGALPEAAAYVGDQPVDVLSAKAAGALAVVVGWTVAPRAAFDAVGVDRWIERMDDLVDLVAWTDAVHGRR